MKSMNPWIATALANYHPAMVWVPGPGLPPTAQEVTCAFCDEDGRPDLVVGIDPPADRKLGIKDVHLGYGHADAAVACRIGGYRV